MNDLTKRLENTGREHIESRLVILVQTIKDARGQLNDYWGSSYKGELVDATNKAVNWLDKMDAELMMIQFEIIGSGDLIKKQNE